jgi:hypothetical protein
MDRPEGTGTAATYNYRHFVQLLAIKLRQREGLTLEAIKRELQEVTGDALERRVAQALAPILQTSIATNAARDGEEAAIWRRIRVADGVELHVRDDSPAANEDVVVAMREAVRTALGRSEVR